METTVEELRRLQSQPLDIKVKMTEQRLRQWVSRYGEDGVYISFSGGKDSTVLLHIARKLYPKINALFVDVPTQFPELRTFAQSIDNVEIIKPRISFVKVCEDYGFPMISKEISQVIYEARYQAKLRNIRPEETSLYKRRFDPESEHVKQYPSFALTRWAFMYDSQFNVSHKCCVEMKKQPAKDYEKRTGRLPILATMADESKLRETEWVKHGCNFFDGKRPSSKPMSFWTEQDILKYIVENDLEICSVYGDIVEDYGKDVEGQMSFADFGMCEKAECKYKCTGYERTGCMLCGFGAHMENECNSRFCKLKKTHPKMYALLDVVKSNGVTFRQAIEWTNKHLKRKIIL